MHTAAYVALHLYITVRKIKDGQFQKVLLFGEVRYFSKVCFCDSKSEKYKHHAFIPNEHYSE